MFPDASIHRRPAAREAPCGIRIIIEWITPERLLLTPPPHDLLGFVGNEPRCVQLPRAGLMMIATTTSSSTSPQPISSRLVNSTPARFGSFCSQSNKRGQRNKYFHLNLISPTGFDVRA